MKITLRQIEIFINVAKTGHLTNVAKTMKLSQSAVSMSLKELENIIGHQLFDRINKKLMLNETGRSFYDDILPVFNKFSHIEHEYKNSENRGTIVIGASKTIVDYLMPTIICNYMESYPDVTIKVKEGNTKDIEDMIKNGMVDIGFIEGLTTSTDIEKSKIGVDELIIVSANKDLIQTKKIDELLNKKWILREEGSGTREVFLGALKEKAKDINIFLELGHTEAIKGTLVHQNYITCVSRLAVEKEVSSGSLYEIDIPNLNLQRDFSILYHKNKYKTALLDKFSFYAKRFMVQMLDETTKRRDLKEDYSTEYCSIYLPKETDS